MKKVLALIVSAVLSLSILCSCSDSESNTADSSSVKTTEASTTTTASSTTTTTTTTEETTTTTTEETTTTTEESSKTDQADTFDKEVTIDNVVFCVPQNAAITEYKGTGLTEYRTKWGMVSCRQYENDFWNITDDFIEQINRDADPKKNESYHKITFLGNPAIYGELCSDTGNLESNHESTYEVVVAFNGSKGGITLGVTSNVSYDDAKKQYEEFIKHITIKDSNNHNGNNTTMSGKATGDRPNIKAKANLYMCRDFTQGALVYKHIIASTDYDRFCTSPTDPIATTKEIQGNDFMDSLDKKCSNGKWERVPEKDDGSSLAYRFTGTTKDTSVQYRNFVILVNVWKDGRFVGNFSNDNEILDEYKLFGYIFTN